MHKPAACGARPAQHESVHAGPAAMVSSGSTLAARPASRMAANTALAIRDTRFQLVNIRRGASIVTLTVHWINVQSCHSRPRNLFWKCRPI
jgi:hypothetical protein